MRGLAHPDNRPRRITAKERGTAIAEFAIVVPVALLLLLGAVDFGRVWTVANATANAAHAGAQYGSQNPTFAGDIDGMRAAAVSDLQNSAVLSGKSSTDPDAVRISDFTVTPLQFCQCPDGSEIACANKCPGAVTPSMFVRVRIDTRFETLFDYPGIPQEVAISRVAVLRAR